jgi:hypothetical protein
MDNGQLLDICLKITGGYEGGVPSYTTLTGNPDGMGISGGILQWNAGQGTLQHLINLAASSMGWSKAQSYFKSSIQQFASLDPAAAIAFAKVHYLDDANQNNVDPAAAAAWKAFLADPAMVAAQQSLAETTVLASAQKIAAEYVPEYAQRSRAIAFFFDVVTQEGSMATVPVNPNGSGSEALSYAMTQNKECAELWQSELGDPLTSVLLYYGYERAKLGRAEYIWNCLGRRGTIAARKGFFENTHFDFTNLLD